MYLAAINSRSDIEPGFASAAVSTDHEIRAFLTGETNGEDLLHALYDEVLDEPIPERLLAVLRG